MAFVTVTESQQVATVKLNRPDIRNAFDPQMIAEITAAFQALDQRADLRAVVLRGEGKVFCAGADLNWMKEMVKYTLPENREDSLKLFAMFEAISRCSLPVVGVVHGAAFGGAVGLVATCDYVMAENKTQFCFSEVKLGLAPAVISGFVLRKTLPGKIRHWMMSAAVFTAAQAAEAGLVHEIADAADLEGRLAAVLAQYRDNGPESVRATKELLNEMPGLTWEEQKELSTNLIAERRISAEGQEGLLSFLEKRTPSWRGSR